jgi:hypothetical protein
MLQGSDPSLGELVSSEVRYVLTSRENLPFRILVTFCMPRLCECTSVVLVSKHTWPVHVAEVVQGFIARVNVVIFQ